MGKCEKCGSQIADNYKFCVACNIENRKTYSKDAENKVLQQINWNLGSIALALKTFLALQINDQKMANECLNKINKIKEEQEK